MSSTLGRNQVNFTRIKDPWGRPRNERNDCAVLALAASTSADYTDAWKFFDALGRRYARGTSIELIRSTFDQSPEILNCTFRRVKNIGYTSKKSLKVFLRENPVGNFYCIMNGHAFAINDGTLVDTIQLAAGSRIFHAWQVVKKGQIAPTKTAPRAEKKAVMKKPASSAMQRRANVLQTLVVELRKQNQAMTVTQMSKLFDDPDAVWGDINWLVTNHGSFQRRRLGQDVVGKRKHYVFAG
jgi:hypothetical protein